MKVTFIVVNTYPTYVAVRYENESVPFKRRTVTLELTPEQLERLNLRETGRDGEQVWREEVLGCFVEAES